MRHHRTRLSLVLIALFSFFLGILVASPPAVLRAFDPSAKATPTISKKMNANQVDNIHAAKTPVKNRLLALDADSKFPLSVMPDGLQRRVSGNCVPGSAVRAVNSDGSVECEDFPGGVPTPTAIHFPSPVPTATAIHFPSPVPTATAIATPTRNPADITGVTAGAGLTGGGSQGNVTLNADVTYLQRRVSNQCSVGSAIRSIAEDGTVACQALSNIVYVAKNDGAFSSIQDALNSITDNSAINPYLVFVAPGVYQEVVTMKPYVDLEGAGELVTKITANSSMSGGQGTLNGGRYR